MYTKNETRTLGLIALIAALLGGSAALAMEAPPIVRGDEHHDIRYPFAWAPRSGHAMVYDTARERAVVYGGLSADWQSTPNERVYPTAEWDGEYWNSVRTASFPPANTRHAMAYDAERGVTVLFGGRDAAGNILDETWLYDGTNWTRATPAVSPAGRVEHAMAYDSVSKRVLLYGGRDGASDINANDLFFRDFWAWDGVNWTELDGVPADMPALCRHAMAHDEYRGVTVLFGGRYSELKDTDFWGNPRGYARMELVGSANTWEWNGTAWSNINPTPSLSSLGVDGSWSSTMTYDSDSKRILAMSWNGNNGLWAYDGASWVTTNAVGKRGLMTYDAARKEVVVFISGTHGGGAATAATWTLPGTTWRTSGFFLGHAGMTSGGRILFTDVNGDGRPDLLMAGYLPNASRNGYAQAVALFLNGPSGFDYRPAWKILSSSTVAALGDMNDDGLPDLALGNSVYLGVSEGVFASTPAWSKSGFVATGPWIDVTGDGLLDLVGTESAAVVVYANTGSTLANNPAVSRSTPADMTRRGVAWGDVNLNGAVDLAISFQSNISAVPHEVRIYTNNGTGTFTLDQTLYGYYGDIAFADLDGDYWPDLVGPSFAYTNHEGSFGSEPSWTARPLTSVAPHAYQYSIEIGDVDGDGDPDLAVFLIHKFIGDAAEAHVYRNDAGILTEVPVWSAAVKIDPVTARGALGDADGDGILDVATQRGIFLLDRMEHTAALPLPAPMWLRAGVNPADRTTALVEWDPVQNPDVAGYRLYADFRVRKRRGIALSVYSHTALLAEVPATQTPQFVVTSNLIAEASLWNERPFYNPQPCDRPDEMDHDGHLERWGVQTVVRVATVDKAGREFGFSGPVSLGALEPENSAYDSTTDFWWGPSFAFMNVPDATQLVGDLDGDGDLDLFVALTSLHPVADNTRVRWVVYTNDGSGSFDQAWEWRQDDDPAVQHGPGRVVPLSLADVTGNGRPDLLCSAQRNIVNPETGLVEIRWVLTTYTNTMPDSIGFARDVDSDIILPVGYSIAGHAWGDANGDGRQDLVVIEKSETESYRSFARLYLNQAGRLDGVPAWTSVEDEVTLVAFGDLDQDGRADLALCNGWKRATESTPRRMGAVVYKGTASGLAATPAWSNMRSSLDGRPVALTWADFNGDGWQDLTVHGYDHSDNRNHPTVLYRNNAGTLTYLCVYKARDYLGGSGVGIGGSSGFTLGWADMNNNGKLDLWGRDLILEAGTPTFNAGPIGDQPAYWHGHAGEEGMGYNPPFSGVVGVYDFNGNGTPDFLRRGTLMLRTPNSIYQADFVPIQYGEPYTPPGEVLSGKLELRPVGSLVLDGEGATQAITVVHVMEDLSEQVISSTDENLELSLSGNPENGLPYAILSSNVLTAVRDGTVTMNAKYGNLTAGASLTTFLTATKSVRVINAAPVPDYLEITPTRVTLERIGEIQPLTVSRQYAADGRVENVTAGSTFYSSDPAVVTLDGRVVIAQGSGEADVVATYNGMTATSRVTVTPAATLTGLTLYPPAATVSVGETRGFEVRAHYSDGTVQPVTFLSSFASAAPGIASVTEWQVLGVSPGFADITAGYLGLSAAALVAVDAPAEPPHLEILGLQFQGNNVILDWYSTPSTGQYIPFTVWTSTNLVTDSWVPLPDAVPRHPSGFNHRTESTGGSPAMFYRVTSP